jgi:hypothetical protein
MTFTQTLKFTLLMAQVHAVLCIIGPLIDKVRVRVRVRVRRQMQRQRQRGIDKKDTDIFDF